MRQREEADFERFAREKKLAAKPDASSASAHVLAATANLDAAALAHDAATAAAAVEACDSCAERAASAGPVRLTPRAIALPSALCVGESTGAVGLATAVEGFNERKLSHLSLAGAIATYGSASRDREQRPRSARSGGPHGGLVNRPWRNTANVMRLADVRGQRRGTLG